MNNRDECDFSSHLLSTQNSEFEETLKQHSSNKKLLSNILNHAIGLIAEINKRNTSSHDRETKISPLLKKIESLLKYGVDLSITDDDWGRTSLHYAAEYQLEQVVPMLLNAVKGTNFDFNQKDNSGKTILWLAVQHRKIRVCLCSGAASEFINTIVPKILDAASGRIDADSEYGGLSPLCFAADYNCTAAVVALVRAGADPDKKYNFVNNKRIICKGIEKDTSVLGLIDYKLSQKCLNKDLINLKESILLEKECNILKKLISASESTLNKYEQNRTGFFSISPDPQRLHLITEMRNLLSQMKENINDKNINIDDVRRYIIQLLQNLESNAKKAESHHKKHGTMVFCGIAFTKSTLSRELTKIISSDFVKHIEIDNQNFAKNRRKS